MSISKIGKTTWLSIVLLASLVMAGSGGNLLVNAGFEQPLEPAWEKNVEDNKQCKLYRVENAGRNGAAVLLENLEPAYTRLRQGFHDRSVTLVPGSLVEFSAWVKSTLSPDGSAQIQLKCRNEKGRFLSGGVNRSKGIIGPCDWTRVHVTTYVPEGTIYAVPYLQIRGGTGQVLFDDVALTVKRQPLPQEPLPRIVLLTDLAETNAVIQSARILFEDGLVRVKPDLAGHALKEAAGALVLYEGAVPRNVWPALDGFARRGGRVFMDIRSFVRSHDAEPVAVEVGKGKESDASLEASMDAGLRIVKTTDATAGFAVGQIMPRAGWPDGKLFVLPAGFSLPDLDVLGVAPGGEAGLVQLPVGEGMITACDLLSLREPYHLNVDAYYAFTPVSGALGNRVRFGQYYPRKLSYGGVVEEMKRLAATYPAIRIEEEGLALEDNRVWSLNLGKPGTPLYFLYAATHGHEWEPGYGLMTLARLLAEGEFADVIDLEKAQIKIMPILNPTGYKLQRRQNANQVDLNRQGDYRWETFKGRNPKTASRYGPGRSDWKGTAPFGEPEAQIYRKIIALPNLYCLLDFHGNRSAANNKLAVIPYTSHPANEMRALNLREIVNKRLRGRHLLWQLDEKVPSQYLLDHISWGSARPTLLNSGARDRFGLTIELTAMYKNSFGTALQTDVTCELCRALFLAYPVPETWPQ